MGAGSDQGRTMYEPKLFRDRSRLAQVVLGGVVPALVGGLAGVLIGALAAAYWGVAVLAAIGAFVGGFEHRDGWGVPIVASSEV